MSYKSSRNRINTLLSEVQQQRATTKRQRTVVTDDVWASNASVLGTLPPDLVCLVLKHVVFLSPHHGCVVERQQAAHASVQDVCSALSSCNYIDRCFRDSGALVRLEVAARGCTSLTPTDTASETPYFDQVMLEERSRFDVRMLESALNGMVCHCAEEHCRGVRRAHNEAIADARKRTPTPMLATVLSGRTPRIKVAWPSSVRSIAVASVDGRVVAAHTHKQKPGSTTRCSDSLLSLRDEPPNVFHANTDMSLVRRFDVDIKSDDASSLVDHVTMSPCGDWIAVVSTTVGSDACLQLWESGGDKRLRGMLRLSQAHVNVVWFRRDATTLYVCFVASHGLTPSSWCRNDVHQYDVEREFPDVCRRSELGPPVIDEWDRPSLRPLAGVTDWAADEPAWSTVPTNALMNSSLIDTSVAASGTCVAAVVSGRTMTSNMTMVSTVQVVYYECASRTRPQNVHQARIQLQNDDVKAVSEHYLVRIYHIPTFVALSPCGDTVVVLLQAGNGEFFVHVHIRVSPRTGFICASRMRLEDAIRRPSAIPIYRTVRTPPSASVFSPCGRFLLIAFEENVTLMSACKPGLCVFDLSEVWSRWRGATPRFAQRRDASWIGCRYDLLPLQMLWTPAGLWLRTRPAGLLLLGLSAYQSK